MIKLKQALMGVGLMFCAMLNVAQADTFNLGTLSSDQLYTVNNTVGAAPGPWEDIIYFSVNESTYLQTALYSLSFQTMGAVDNFLIQLYSTDTLSYVFESSSLSQVEDFIFSVDAGNYAFNLSGSGDDGRLPGFYNLAISPVPEAPLYSLMLTGLAFLGLTLRKKKNK